MSHFALTLMLWFTLILLAEVFRPRPQSTPESEPEPEEDLDAENPYRL